MARAVVRKKTSGSKGKRPATPSRAPARKAAPRTSPRKASAPRARPAPTPTEPRGKTAATKPAAARSSTRSAKASEATAAPPPVAPPRPQVSEADRREAIAVAAEKLREKAWGEQGQPITTVEGVTIAFAQLSRGRPHWHLWTFGLALEGMELSIRVLKGKEEVAPPAWPVALLSGLVSRARAGRLAADTNQVLLVSNGVGPAPAPGPGNTVATPDFVGLIFTPDPDLQKLVTPHDVVPVLQAVPVTADEVRAVREWSPAGLVEVLSKVDPMLITDLDRVSLLQSPRARALIEQRIEREGSSLSTLTSEGSAASQQGARVTWRLPLESVETVISLLKGRIGHLRPFSVSSPSLTVEVVNADKPSVHLSGQRMTLKLSLVAARQLRSLLRAKVGTYTFDAISDLEVMVVE